VVFELKDAFDLNKKKLPKGAIKKDGKEKVQ
jgi:hypothetical protein